MSVETNDDSYDYKYIGEEPPWSQGSFTTDISLLKEGHHRVKVDGLEPLPEECENLGET